MCFNIMLMNIFCIFQASYFNPNNAFVFYEFLEAIIRIALEASVGMEMKPSECVASEIMNRITPSLEKLICGPVRDVRHSPDVSVVVDKNFSKIQKVYTKYCRTEATKSDNGDNLKAMKLEEFVVLMSFCGFIDDKKVTTDDAKLVFAQSQRVTMKDDDEETPDLEEIIFVEFIEAIARMALKFYEKEDMISTRRKIQKGLETIIAFSKNC